jgi:hypothetical protein
VPPSLPATLHPGPVSRVGGVSRVSRFSRVSRVGRVSRVTINHHVRNLPSRDLRRSMFRSIRSIRLVSQREDGREARGDVGGGGIGSGGRYGVWKVIVVLR